MDPEPVLVRLLFFGWGKAATTCLEKLFEDHYGKFKLTIVSHTSQDEEARLDTCLKALVEKYQSQKLNGLSGKNSNTDSYQQSNSQKLSPPPEGVISSQYGANNDFNCYLFPDNIKPDDWLYEQFVENPSSNLVLNDNTSESETTTTVTQNSKTESSDSSPGPPVINSVCVEKQTENPNPNPLRPHLLISVSYRRLISPKGLQICPGRSINFHPSLLPRHRGCFSGFWTILDGDSETGVSCHHMLEKFDTGKIIHCEKLQLDGKETAKSLYNALLPITQQCFGKVIGDFFNTKSDTNESYTIPEGYDQESNTKPSYHRRKLPFNGEFQKEWDDVYAEHFIRAMTFPPLQGAVYVNKENERIVCDSLEEYMRVKGT